MKASLVRIGNSRGVRIPRELLSLFGLHEGDELELEARREGILVRPLALTERTLSWAAAYDEMAAEPAEGAEWQEWDATAGDSREG
jgi:antitoxin component of MazEF toxin-antitoxin module